MHGLLLSGFILIITQTPLLERLLAIEANSLIERRIERKIPEVGALSEGLKAS